LLLLLRGCHPRVFLGIKVEAPFKAQRKLSRFFPKDFLFGLQLDRADKGMIVGVAKQKDLL
jgi:hypothetical protein